jgi:hypothetical protein
MEVLCADPHQTGVLTNMPANNRMKLSRRAPYARIHRCRHASQRILDAFSGPNMALPMLRITVLVLAVLLLPARSVAQADGAASAVAGARAQLNEAFARGDLATIATLLSSEVVMMSESGTWSSLEHVLGIHRSLFARRPGITLESRPESVRSGRHNGVSRPSEAPG